VAVPDQRRTAPLRSALHRIRDTRAKSGDHRSPRISAAFLSVE
jgi:hypothetical protein